MRLPPIALPTIVALLMLSVGAFILLLGQGPEYRPMTADLHGQRPKTTEAEPKGRDRAYIVQGASLHLAEAAVVAVGGVVQHELGIIKAVSAHLTGEQHRLLATRPEIRLYANEATKLQGWRNWGKANEHTHRYKSSPEPGMRGKRFFRHYAYLNADTLEAQEFEISNALDTQYPRQTGAMDVHREGITGNGVTVAVIDSGIARTPWLGGERLKAEFDATLVGNVDRTRAADTNGHGSHVTSIIASQGKTPLDEYNSIAPNASLVSVKAFDENGMGNYSDVINGIDWILRHRKEFGIRVINMSFGTPPSSAYWDDPLGQAVMVAWQQGLVVVASAGNSGPEPMTIGVPGNVPYVITVGAVTDAYTPDDSSDDTIVSFSAAGPTFEAHVKPDVVAYGGHMLGLMASDATIAINHPEFQEEDSDNYYLMSGTSQAAAVVSGVVALMLEAAPELSNDDIKCRLLSSAKASVGDREYAYSIFQQGAGLVDARHAINSSKLGCANTAFDIDLDISGADHFIGPARLDSAGKFYLDGTNANQPGASWEGDYVRGVNYHWSSNNIWNNGSVWNSSFLWNNGFLWNNAFLWNESFLWNDSSVEVAGINSWVEQE